MSISEKLVIVALAIALIALGLSIYTAYSIFQINKKITEMDETLTEREPIIEKFIPLLPQFETLNELLPRMKQFLIGLPSASVE